MTKCDICQKHDFYLAQFAYPGFNYVILWPQMQTYIKVQSQPLSHVITAKPITLLQLVTTRAHAQIWT